MFFPSLFPFGSLPLLGIGIVETFCSNGKYARAPSIYSIYRGCSIYYILTCNYPRQLIYRLYVSTPCLLLPSAGCHDISYLILKYTLFVGVKSVNNLYPLNRVINTTCQEISLCFFIITFLTFDTHRDL